MSLQKTVHPFAAFALFLFPAVLCMFVFSPVALMLCFAGGLLSALVYSKAEACKILLITAAMFPVVLGFNFLFSHQGESVLFTVGKVRFTAESLVFAAMAAVMISAVSLWFCAFFSACGSGGIYRLFSGVFPSFCMLVSITLRMVPLTARRAACTKEAMSVFIKEKPGLGARMTLASGQLLSVAARSFEESVITADSMRSRGYDIGIKRTDSRRRKIRPGEAVCVVFMSAMFVLSLVFVIKGSFSYDVFALGLTGFWRDITTINAEKALSFGFLGASTMYPAFSALYKCLKRKRQCHV